MLVWWIFSLESKDLNLLIIKEDEKNILLKIICQNLLNIFDLYLGLRISEDLNLAFEKNPNSSPNQPGLKEK